MRRPLERAVPLRAWTGTPAEGHAAWSWEPSVPDSPVVVTDNGTDVVEDEACDDDTSGAYLAADRPDTPPGLLGTPPECRDTPTPYVPIDIFSAGSNGAEGKNKLIFNVA